jgi:citrate synthase|uniref:Uncharacterized protein n=1 Tax=Zea mays TaxID=4577 RepID=B6SPN1_MAIZE|nr:hypothetical protein [Zea mays]
MDRADPARGRLAVLSSHLRGAGAEEAAGLERSPVSAPAPGPRAGALAVVDGRTGKRHEVKVSEDGTVRATDFKKVPSSERGLTVPAVAPCRAVIPRGLGVLAF